MGKLAFHIPFITDCGRGTQKGTLESRSHVAGPNGAKRALAAAVAFYGHTATSTYPGSEAGSYSAAAFPPCGGMTPYLILLPLSIVVVKKTVKIQKDLSDGCVINTNSGWSDLGIRGATHSIFRGRQE
ncbi:hypothetical protein CALCODRAFT_552914 [Calocera cornea HHB12733]|uniref:Uncharacterized protein n=1 Tax=Calocera cornea HHB12733 TaxID=1353952 RepID=A0A165JHP3_9BASI|nr:hypothetical protein CALCODRAFT_552914 [Calocera cornea HHB12733]